MGDIVNLADHHRREGYRIVVAPGLWRGFEVRVEPPTSTHPLRTFRSADDAMRCAKELRRVEGWPIVDMADDFPPGGHAA